MPRAALVLAIAALSACSRDCSREIAPGGYSELAHADVLDVSLSYRCSVDQSYSLVRLFILVRPDCSSGQVLRDL